MLLIYYNSTALVTALVLAIPNYLVFGMLLPFFGKWDEPDFALMIAAYSAQCFALDIILRMSGDYPIGRRLLDPRCGGYFYYVPVWFWGILLFTFA